MQSRKVPIEDVVLHERCQARAELHHDTITEYAEIIASGVELPPVRCASVGGVLHLIDGYHRIGAYRQAGVTFVRVEVVDADSLARAEWLAVAANQGHGLRRSNADKRKAVRMALANPIGAEQSSNVIAQHLGVSDKLVSEIRREVELRNSEVDPNPPKRIGKDGKARPATMPKKPRENLGEVSPQTDSPKASAPEWTPPPSRPVKPETREPREPMPDASGLLRAAEILRAARLECAKVLPESYQGGVIPALQAVEGRLRADVPVVCSECSGKGCAGCAKRGWRFSGTDRTEARRARA